MYFLPDVRCNHMGKAPWSVRTRKASETIVLDNPDTFEQTRGNDQA